MNSENRRPPFDEKMAAQYIGKTVLIGVSYYDGNDTLLKLEQMHGVISAVSEQTGITVELAGANKGATRHFPPNIQSLKVAQRGDYTLRQTGEVVVDPDFLWTWNISEDAHD